MPFAEMPEDCALRLGRGRFAAVPRFWVGPALILGVCLALIRGLL
jgi:hypothetical protein